MNILRLLTLLSFFLTSSSSPTDHRTGRTDTPEHAVAETYSMNENYVSAIVWLSLVCLHATARVSEGAFPWLGLQRAGATV